jgi:predicted Zn-dependent protease
MRWFWFSLTLALLCGGLLLSQTRKIDAPVAPNALMYLVADTERELTRLPMAYTRIPDEQEIKIGDSIARTQQAELSEENKQIEAYVQRVGQRVAAHAHRKLPYRFHYIPERYFINAFALPGGHVFIGAGLLEQMDSEDELAAVLGHEVEHIDHYHCVERLQVEAALKKIPLGELVAIPMELFETGYTKDQELEVDREGTQLTVRAGYSPQGAVDMFSRFQKMEEQVQGKATTPGEEMSSAAIQILTGYFRSHPRSADRAAQIRSLMAHENWKPGRQKPLEVKYIFLGYEAQDQVAAAHYDKAIQAAEESLKLHSGYARALVALAKAKVATNDFVAAAAAYKELLAHYPNDADAVRNFVGQLVDLAMRDKKYSDAARLASFSLDLQPNNANALQLLAEVDLELGDIKAATEVGEKLRKLYPNMGAVLVQHVNNSVDQALQRHDYNRAAQFAAYSLALEPLQPETRSQLAQAEFNRANFRAAANAYAKLIEDSLRHKDTLAPETVRSYADALGSLPDHKQAASEFQSVLPPLAAERDDFGFQVRIEGAGLFLMAGDESQAVALAKSATTPASEAFAPEHIARLAWWYYRAGKTADAQDLLRRVMALRPGDAGLQQTMGWVMLEKGAPQEALRMFENIQGQPDNADALHAGQTIARWRLHQADSAMQAFDGLISSAPEWRNEQWVKSIYGTGAAQSLREMEAEQEKRIAARKAGLRKP